MFYSFNLPRRTVSSSCPPGKLETIGGVPCYIATPTVDYPKDKVILFLPDVFGIELENAKVCSLLLCPPLLLKPQQLLADDFAQNGFKVRTSAYPTTDKKL